jgi:hypothetical protein|tara:strand:+ start:143 stop:544 length:402 start_codon:yes stop_codon:yes gene_type:complete
MSAVDVALGIILTGVRFKANVESWNHQFGFRARPEVYFTTALTENQIELIQHYVKVHGLPERMRTRAKSDVQAWLDYLADYETLLTDGTGYARTKWLLENPVPHHKDGWEAFVSWAEKHDEASEYITNQRKRE